MATAREVEISASLGELEEAMHWEQVKQIDHETQRELLEKDLKETSDPRTLRNLRRSKRKREALIEQTATKIVQSTKIINETKEELEDLHSQNPERQKQYKESGRILKKAMSAGTVLVQFIMCIIVGAAGVGKTCLRSLLLGEAPPTTRNSTCLEVPVQIHVRKSQALVDSVGGGWKKTNDEDLLSIITRVVLRTEENESIITKLKNTLKSYIPFTGHADDLTPLTRTSRAQSPTFLGLPSASQRAIVKIINKLQKKITNERKANKGNNRGRSNNDLCYKWIYFTDSGGQKPFQELLPLFVHGNSAIIAVIRLCDRLDEHPTIEYYKDDHLRSKQLSELTTKEMIQHLIRSLKSMESSEAQASQAGNHSLRSLFVVGTHKDQLASCSESLDKKNKRLLDKEMLGRLHEHLVYVDPKMTKIVFPVNTQTPKQADQKVAGAIRKQITDCIPVKEKKIPIWWYILQLVLLELAHQLEKSILSFDECVLIAKAFDFSAREVEEALKFFHDLNVFHYYPHIVGLKRIVFTDSQVPLDKVSELVNHSFELRGANTSSENSKRASRSQTATEAKWKRFRDHGIVTVDCLKDQKFSTHYVDGLFTADEFLELLQNLLAVAPLSLSQSDKNTEYLMPSLLETLSSVELEAHCADKEVVPPLLLIFPDGWPRFGTFCCLVVYLMKLTGWQVLKDETENLPKVARNFSQFDAHVCKITMIDSFTYLEIHVAPLLETLSSTKAQEHCSKKCPLIVRDILKGIIAACKALRYENVAPKLQYGFFCSHDTQPGPPPSKRQRLESGSSSSNDKHPAVLLREDGYLKCAKTSLPPYELEDQYKVWDDVISLVPKIIDVINAVDSVVNWHRLGLNLQLRFNKLDEIDREYRTISERRDAMINLWFHTDTHPSWSKLCAALEAMDENAIAADIRSRH